MLFNLTNLETTINKYLCSPITQENLFLEQSSIISLSGEKYPINDLGIIQFTNKFCSQEAKIQQKHYDQVSTSYVKNLDYPHTQEYTNYLDQILRKSIANAVLNDVAELACGRGEAFRFLGNQVKSGIGVDVSLKMLEIAQQDLANPNLTFIQADATILPLKSNIFDSVFMLGGIHHIPNRQELFKQVYRILKPGGYFYWREPVDDFFLWRWLRKIIYYLSPALDHTTESPLRYQQTVDTLENVGFQLKLWRTCGFFGFCIFMNSDVLIVNRLFRFLPGIRQITRLAIAIDDWIVKLPLFRRCGLQVIGMAQKPLK